MSYPPEPWDLRGQLHLTVWRMPLADLPALPPGLSPVRLGSCALVGTAWVAYEPGGMLSYWELLVAVLVWHGRRLRVLITDIWVDSVPSLRGGRELWGIPKELATFDFAGQRFVASTLDGAPIARGMVTPRVGLPGRWPARYSVVQDGETPGDLAVTPVRGSAALRLTHATWEFAPDGPLDWLAGTGPVLSASLRDFRLRFGR